MVWSPVALPDTIVDHPPVTAWEELSTGMHTGADADAGVVVWEWGSGGEDVVGSVYAATHQVLGVLQSWLGGRAGRGVGGADPWGGGVGR